MVVRVYRYNSADSLVANIPRDIRASGYQCGWNFGPSADDCRHIPGLQTNRRAYSSLHFGRNAYFGNTDSVFRTPLVDVAPHQ